MSRASALRTASRSILFASSTMRPYLSFWSGRIACPLMASSAVYASSSESVIASIIVDVMSSIARVQHATCFSLKLFSCTDSLQSHRKWIADSFAIWFWNEKSAASKCSGAHARFRSTACTTLQKSVCSPSASTIGGCPASSSPATMFSGTVDITPRPGILFKITGSSSSPCTKIGSASERASAFGFSASKSILLMVRLYW
mmetsp:Transcript_52432/g.123872  ORF Transcript_52432/g.123872 Transcript_52432/m.123872 type:complete len:201 (-) Transcript_52432:150-752(-)